MFHVITNLSEPGTSPPRACPTLYKMYKMYTDSPAHGLWADLASSPQHAAGSVLHQRHRLAEGGDRTAQLSYREDAGVPGHAAAAPAHPLHQEEVEVQAPAIARNLSAPHWTCLQGNK